MWRVGFNSLNQLVMGRLLIKLNIYLQRLQYMRTQSLQINPQTEKRKERRRPRQKSNNSACGSEELVLSIGTLWTEDCCPVPSLVKGLRNTDHLEAIVHTLDPSNIEDVCLTYRAYLGLFGQLGWGIAALIKDNIKTNIAPKTFASQSTVQQSHGAVGWGWES